MLYLKEDIDKIPNINSLTHSLTLWLMELRGSLPHSQGLSNNPYPEPNQPLFLALTPIF